MYNFFSILILTTAFLFSSCSDKSSIISGSITENNIKYVLYSNPDLPICYDKFMDTVKVNNYGSFEIQLSSKENRFIIIEIPEKQERFIIPVQSGEEYHLSIGENNKIEVEGMNEEGIELYQTVLQYSAGNLDWSLFNNGTSNRDENIQQLKFEELNKFRKLLTDKKITKSFYDLIEKDRDCFYAFVSSWLYSWDMMSIIRNQESVNDKITKEKVLKNMSYIFNTYKPDDKDLMKSPSWESYALFMYIDLYKQYSTNNVDNNNVEKILMEEHIPFWSEQITKSFSGDILEAVLAVFIYKKGGLENFTVSDACIPVYEYFKDEFPESKYTKYFDYHMIKTISFYNQVEINSSINFIENRDSINTFSELLTQLRGQKLYVDIWATWCNPCRYEFQFSDSLHAILQKNNITPLYISLDEDSQHKRWEALVHTYDLKGFHLRANKYFKDDLNKIYNDNKSVTEKQQNSISILWYMLIDENGNIIEKQFKRPSEIVLSKNPI